jgi:N,N'-diacetyllegionaminate synthase
MHSLSKAFIIAEAGVNHNGNVITAMKLVDMASSLGADGIKFQTFKAKNFVKKNTPKVSYQKINDKNKSHYEMIKKLELSFEDFLKLKKYCSKKKIAFISTPYDLESLDFLESIKVKIIKTASADLSDIMLHEKIAKMNVKTIISTGMFGIKEIKKTLSLYRNKKNVELLHCVSNYPCTYESLNLNNITTLRNQFNIPVGFSDHSIGYSSALIAFMLGARTFERHITLSKKMNGPDHKSSADPREFKEYIKNIRLINIILGSKIKKIRKEEIEMKKVSCKSITIKKFVEKNSLISYKDIIMKRPGVGLSGYNLKKIIGKRAKKKLQIDYQVKLSDIK